MDQCCKLCGCTARLLQSHVVPAFVFKWKKKTAPTGYLRFSMEPNRRVQDGIKRKWLCADCEQLFSKWEKDFSERVFIPYVEGRSKTLIYGPWMAKFCASLSWRSALFSKERADGLTHLHNGQVDALNSAITTWREFLLDGRADVKSHVFDLLPLGTIEVVRSSLSMPPNINKFLARMTFVDLVSGKHSSYAVAKIGPFLLLGHLLVSKEHMVEGARVRFKRGKLEPREYRVPIEMMEYLTDKASGVQNSLDGMSVVQKEKINRAFHDDPARVIKSDWWAAHRKDLEMRGLIFDDDDE